MIPVPGRYLPACLIHHTGTCSVSSPRAARRNVSFRSWGKSLGLYWNTKTSSVPVHMESSVLLMFTVKHRDVTLLLVDSKSQSLFLLTPISSMIHTNVTLSSLILQSLYLIQFVNTHYGSNMCAARTLKQSDPHWQFKFKHNCAVFKFGWGGSILITIAWGLQYANKLLLSNTWACPTLSTAIILSIQLQSDYER